MADYIYILQLADGNYYVGHTSKLACRLWQHFGASDVAGSAFSSKHKALHVIHLEKSSTSKTIWQARERELTLKLAKVFGFEHVRGGPYTVGDKLPKGWMRALNTVDDINLDELEPLNDVELQTLIKEGNAEHSSSRQKAILKNCLFLSVPLYDIKAVKALGARWHSEFSRWYITTTMNKTPFLKWIKP